MASVSAVTRRQDRLQRITLSHVQRHSTSAEFLVALGMLGVSFDDDGEVLLALPRSIDDYLDGGATGMPLLHPYANRLGHREFDAYGARFDVRDAKRDRNGLPIHGAMHGRPFELDEVQSHPERAVAATSFRFDDPKLLRGFPFPHELRIIVALGERRISVQTQVHNTGDRPMPVSFGWHPFFTLPARPRADWTLRIPPCRRHVLDDHMLPTGETEEQPEDRSPIGTHTYDDHFDLGDDRVFEIASPERTLRIEFDEHYPHAQIYLPAPDWPLAGDFVCIEPMVARTNALVAQTAPTVAPDATFSATFTVRVT